MAEKRRRLAIAVIIILVVAAFVVGWNIIVASW